MSKELKKVFKLDEKQIEAVRKAAREDAMPVRELLRAAVYDYLEYRRVELGRMEI